MAMTCDQMVNFCHEQAESWRRAAESAAKSSNCEDAAPLVVQSALQSLLEGLIRWRVNIGSPVPALQDMVRQIRGSLEVLRSMPVRAGVVSAQATVIAFLVNEAPVGPDTGVLAADCLLDAALGYALRDRWDHPTWKGGLGELQSSEHTALSAETYSTYYRLLRAQSDEVDGLVARAVVLFEDRRDDPFYMGGPQTEGGCVDNDVVVDYRLAAVMKKIGYQGENIHRWRWG
jgi:hypothetical protein